jgi:hypothetical protein
VCLGVFEGKKTFLELGFEFTDFGVTGVVAAQKLVLRSFPESSGNNRVPPKRHL